MGLGIGRETGYTLTPRNMREAIPTDNCAAGLRAESVREIEIIAAIDATKAKRIELIKQAGQCDNESQVLKINAQVRRIEDSTLPHLKQALAAMRTEFMTAITSDPTVVI